MKKEVYLGKTTTILVCFAMVLALVQTVAFAEEAPTAEILVINIDKAVEIANENNLSLAMARLDLEYAEKQLIKAHADVALSPSPVALRQAEVAVETQKLLLEQTRRQVELQVRSAYYETLSKIQQRAIAERNLAQVKEKKSIIGAKHGEGLATKLDLVNAEKSLLQAKGSLELALAGEELAILELKRILGLTYGEQLTIELSDVVPDSIEFQPEQVVERVLNNSLDLIRLQWDLEIKQMQEESAKNEYAAPLIKELYANQRMRAELDLKEATRATYLQAKKALNSLRQAEISFELSKKELEAAEESLQITKTRFDGGLELPNELLRTQTDLASAQHGVVDAVLEYNLARIRLLNLMGE